ncbi:hypothetical protein OSH08_06650 [Kaistia geumhonensis]|uniref:Uncharacterized protein n=1 Tax=Kaistia geumhonensis TaxID=410839 RepID=A0ABU0M593_9HYPH|nr:hypothetical protein [Kaistia geumhonensis]MCX5478676.1 hypothetical protein [Kaistia geumhonensis]MDQ0516106.1 hypothetical protein [Kaistia geumhonensis]
MFSIFQQWTLLALESQEVIMLRTARLARSDAGAMTEARRMVFEKVDAAEQAMAALMMGQSQLAVVRGYRRRVRANARRLSKG